MRTHFKKAFALLLALTLAFAAALPAFAASPFDDGAYASILTGSDFQDQGTAAYDRFTAVLTNMKNDGLTTPDSVLVGGDYTKLLFDYAIPGISQIRENLVSVYPDADPERVVCIQGNHDNPASGFTKTGFYDMGVYCLYVINEDDFPWMQGFRPGAAAHVKSIADDMSKNFGAMISGGDLRPVFVLTHLPLHHTDRMFYNDNRYASYLFNALNEAGKTLDIVFLFGHQHSGDYDDYIGGSVNFMAPGDAIRVPRTDAAGENAYTEETLNFTYTNCGYIGYSDNSQTETSTNKLTLGVVRLSENTLRFVKYGEDGLFSVNEVRRKNPGTAQQSGGGHSLLSQKLWQTENRVFLWFFSMFKKLLSLLRIGG